MKIVQEDLGDNGVFKAIENGREVGEMTYYWEDDDTFAINHTEVSPLFEGQGIGKKMMKAAVDYAKSNDKKIIPQCSFAVAMFRAVPQYREVLY